VHSQITGIFIHFKHDWLRANKANKFCLLWGSRRAVDSRKINVISLRVDSRELAPLQIFVGSISVNNLVKNFRDCRTHFVLGLQPQLGLFDGVPARRQPLVPQRRPPHRLRPGVALRPPHFPLRLVLPLDLLLRPQLQDAFLDLGVFADV
jgi:hypothetical protein